MPDWQPVSVPDFCPICGVYWECGCRLGLSEIEAAVTNNFDPKGMKRTLDKFFDNIPDTFTFNKLDSLGLAKADDAPVGNSGISITGDGANAMARLIEKLAHDDA